MAHRRDVNAMTGLIKAALALVLALASGCTLMLSGSAMDGRVVDSETGAPIPGALVIVEWKGDIGGPVQSSQVCFHLEVVRTDEEGRYHVPAWHRRPAADWEGGFFGVRNVEVRTRTYKAGYLAAVGSSDTDVLRIKPFNGSGTERIAYLRYTGTPGCGREDGSLPNELALWTDICSETKGLLRNQGPTAAPSDMAFLREIDAHIESILSGSAQQRYAGARNRQTTCSAM